MTDEPKAIKKEREAVEFIKNKEKPVAKKKVPYVPVKKDSAITIWDSQNGYRTGNLLPRTRQERRRMKNDGYLRNCHRITDLIMIWLMGISFFACWAISFIANSISKR